MVLQCILEESICIVLLYGDVEFPALLVKRRTKNINERDGEGNSQLPSKGKPGT